ncbi:hypothetical protein JCGZ_17628 [Jatropha curcas]|uniref:Apple domain-containing protein n=1 Tax=Jatropha curcas TaxID=180498 RepID=A0A067K2H2_JATCU|nr:hypothetical protein JCGZ_17628 [Jatropha curcas]
MVIFDCAVEKKIATLGTLHGKPCQILAKFMEFAELIVYANMTLFLVELVLVFQVYKVKDSADWSNGCEPEFKNLPCRSIPESMNHGFVKLSDVEFYGYDCVANPGYTLEMCKELCLSLCVCKGFEYRYIGDGLWSLFSVVKNIRPTVIPTMCYIKMALLNGHRSPSFDGDFSVKVPKDGLFSGKEDVLGFGLNSSSEIYNEAAQGYNQIGGFKRFTYQELKKATANFKVEIGRGAGGIGFRGRSSDN